MATIYVVGLGPGDKASLPVGTYELLKSGRPLYLRTAVHPVVQQLQAEGLTFSAFDHVYDTGTDFAQVYRTIAEQLLVAATAQGDIVYAVPGHPIVAEQTVQNLLAMADKVKVRIETGQSFLDAVFTLLRVDPVEGFLLLDGLDLERFEAANPRLHTLIVQVYQRTVASDVKLLLMEVYPDDYPVVVVRAAGVPGEERMEQVPLYELDRIDWLDHLTTVYLPPASDREILQRDPWYGADVVRQLREPGGCPWDREQTHASLRQYVIEEAYEVAEAIDNDNSEALVDELGDLLLQVLLHAQIASEEGDFSVRDVYAALADKLIRGHPHVFGTDSAQTVGAAQRHWQAAKAAEASSARVTKSVLGSVRWGRPVFTVATDIQRRAAEAGFDWSDVAGVLAKVREETEEVEAEVVEPPVSQSPERLVDEVGDLLFAVVNLARWLKVDPELALNYANRKFTKRFFDMEVKIKENHGEITNTASTELEKYWNQAKFVGKNATESRD